jgi:chromosomal replication initiation ATPase DnaA
LNNLSQLSFSFQNDSQKNLFREEDFILLPENSAAVKFLAQFFAQKEFSAAPFTSLLIKGAKACGKTHLINIFSQKFHAEFLKEEIFNLNLTNFFQENKFYFFENIDEIKSDELLLHLINSASEAHAFLILTTRDKEFKLKDLTSRLKNIFTIELKNPTIESIIQLLTNGFSRRQLKLSAPIINFIANNIDRTFEAASNAIKKIEFFCSENGKNLTMKDVKTLFTSSEKNRAQP